MWKKLLITPLAAILLCSMSPLVFASDEMIIKIGHVAPISGPIAHLGKDNENGARMAIEELNTKGIVINGKKVRFILVAEDDAADPKQGTAVAQKLVDAKVNAVAGHMNSGTSIPASKIYFDAGIPQIATSTSTQYNAKGYKSTFRVVADDGQLGAMLGRYAVENLHAKTVAVIDDRTAYGQGLADQFIKEIKRTAPGVKIAQRHFTTDKATDFNGILTAIKAGKPDVIFYGGNDAVAGPMLRQMKTLGIDARLMGGDGVCTEKLATLAGNALKDGQVVCAEAGGVTNAEKKAFDDFFIAYQKRFGIPVQIYAPYVYDSVMLFASAMQQARSSDPAVYLPFLQKIHYKGVTGNIAFDSKGNVKEGTITLYTYKAGKRTSFASVKG